MLSTEPKKRKIIGVSKYQAIMKKESAQASRDRFYRQSRDISVAVPLMVSLEDLYNGKSMKKRFKRYAFCSNKGSKSGASKKCSRCQGSGMAFLITQGMYPCYECKGTGETISETITEEDRCEQCKGNKVVLERDALNVHVEKGMQDGQKIRFSSEVVKSIGGGGMVVILQQKEHPKFERNGDDLFVEHTLSLKEALCGYEFVLTHLDNRQLIVKSQPGEVVNPGEVKVINDEGMPIYQRPFMRGKLYIHFAVELYSLTPDQSKAIQSLVLAPRPSPELTDVGMDE